MKIIKNVSPGEVWNHWKTVEGFTTDDFRSDIRNPIPSDTKWFLAMIEQVDIQYLYIISSGDWSDISKGTFLVKEVANNLSNNSSNEHTIRISNDIKSKENFLRSGKLFDTKLILVSDNAESFLTIIEGNRRSVALLSVGKLIGREVYLGRSNSMKSYVWARYSHE